MAGPPSPVTDDRVPFSDLARAAYCPRQCYYARREDDRSLPAAAAERIDLAFAYPALRTATDDALAERPIEPAAATYRDRLNALAARDDWDDLAAPDRSRVTVAGKDCRGRVHKLLGEDPPTPSIVSPGRPPEEGVWEPATVRAVAAAKAVAWERERSVERAVVEFPAHAVVRDVPITGRRAAAYRRALRAVRSIDGPPARTDDREKCERCQYRERCGTKTRSLRSLLGL